MKILVLAILLAIGSESLSQEVYIPYRKRAYWGIADTNRKIIVEPIYDSVVTSKYFLNGYFKVQKNGMWGVTAVNGTSIPSAFHTVSIRAWSRFIWANNDMSQTLFTVNGDSLFQGENLNVRWLDEFPDHKLFLIQTQNNHDALMHLDSECNEVQDWILKDCEQIEIRQVDDGKNEKCLISFKKGGKEWQTHVFSFNESNNRFEIEKKKIKLASLPQSKVQAPLPPPPPIIEMLEDDEFQQGSRMRPISGDTLMTYKIVENKIYLEKAIVRFKKVEIFSKQFIEIDFGSAEVFELPFKHEVVGVVFSSWWTNYVVYKKNNQVGILCLGQNSGLAFIGSPRNIQIENEEPCFILQNTEGKLGMISLQKELISFEYDELIVIKEKGIQEYNKYSAWLARKGAYFGMINPYNELILPFRYDKIQLVKGNYKSFLLKANGKYGFYSLDGKFEPIFDFQVKGLRRFHNYIVFELYDNNGKFLGYGDKKGFNYFE